MNIPISWLKEYVDIDASMKDFVEDMTMSGSKVETVESLGAEIKYIVVGKILKIEKHPDADKLVITQIDIGNSTIQIVTGANNIKEGDYIPVALDGAVVSGGKVIKKSKLRGVESCGMLCSIEELGYDTHDYPEAPENGIYIFPEPQELGKDACEILQIKEDVVEFEITSNRPDCFSVLGLAREAAATYNKALKYPEISLKEEGEGNISEMVSVEIKNPELCPRYIARVVKNVKICPSPQWMRHKLTASGIRPINNIVDITNYVMLEMGQPMHAFDIENIDEGKIIVRNAYEGEKITTLDGIERNLDSSMLVISDPNKAVAIAGVMGGQNSKVTGESGAILFESANFNGTNIRVTAKKLGLRTDASAKYEKGLDPNQSIESINRCVQLVEELGYGEVVKDVVDCYPNKREVSYVEFSPEGINKLLGTDISKEAMAEMLQRLNIKVEGNKAVIPTFRPDLEREADIAEEIARLYGYNKIDTTIEKGRKTVGKRNHKQIVEDKTASAMAALGFSEIMTYSFESPKAFEKLNIPADSPLRTAAKISNPLGEDFSIMRTTTLNGLLTSLSNNFSKRNEEALLFELGKVYLPKSMPMTELPSEKEILSIGFYDMKAKKDFFYMKAVIEELFAYLNIHEEREYVPEENIAYMHPYRTARIFLGEDEIGYIGEIHPEVCKNYNISQKAYICIIEMEYLIKLSSAKKEYKSLPKYPSVTRDISMLVEDGVSVREIEKAIKEKGGKILEKLSLFDVYKGNQIVEGFKSVSYSLEFRDDEKTLTDEEVSQQMKKILKNLEMKINIQLRDK